MDACPVLGLMMMFVTAGVPRELESRLNSELWREVRPLELLEELLELVLDPDLPEDEE